MMNPQEQFCPNMECRARGKVGEGNSTIHSQKQRRYKCTACGKTFSETRGTALYRVKKEHRLYGVVITLLAYGCPVIAIVMAFGLDDEKVREWAKKAGGHCQGVHQHFMEHSWLDLGQVQADEIKVKKQGRAVWMALGGGMAVVLTPLLFIPAFLARLDNWRRRFVFVVLCGMPLLVLTLPYLIDNFWMVVGGFTGYSSEYGTWGSSYLLRWFTENVWAGPGEGFRGYAITYGSYGLLLALAFFGFAVFPRMQLKHALTFTMLVFYLNPTGFANQYIVLLLPFLILEFENRTAIWYTILASVFGIVVYIGGYVLPPAVFDLFPVWPRPGMILSMPIWAFCVWEFARRLMPHIRHGIASVRRSQPPGSAVVDASKT